jgi:ATP-dependent Clp protease protease subunit
MKQHINQILSERTGQPLSKIEIDVERDYFMNAIEAKEYGLIDQVMEPRVKGG